MGIRPTSGLSKRCDSWNSETTYHSPYEENDIEKAFISNSPKEPDNSREQPKIALRKQFSWIHPLVHILPVAATLGVLQLSFRGVYWDDDSRYDTRWQAVLQFPAKLHEILIVGSLSAMVLHIFRRMLVGPHGIPLGLMVGAFQIGSAEYLINKSFIKPFRHSLFHRHYKMFFVALALGLAILYSFLVGPASAGAIIPILTWWNMAEPFNNSLPLTCYISRDSSQLYPTSLHKSDINTECLGDDWRFQGCPGEGFDPLNDWAYTRVEEAWRYNVTEGQHYNPTMLSSFSGQARREIITKLVASKNSSTAAAMTATLHSSVLALTDAFWHYVNNNKVGNVNKVKRPKFTISRDTQVSIPFVQVQCNSVNYGTARQGGGDPYLTFETGAMVTDFSASNSGSQSKWVVPNEAWNSTRPWNATHVTWIDMSEIKGTQDEQLHSSLAAVVTVPGRFKTYFANGTTIVGQGSVTSPCIIDARWATTDVTFDPKADDVVGTDFTDWLDSSNLLADNINVKAALSRWKISDPISVSPDWVNTLNSPIPVSPNNTLFRGLNFMEYILQQSVDSEPNGNNSERLLQFNPSSGHWSYDDVSNEIALVLSTVLADWLSRSTFRDTNFTTIVSSAEKDGNVSTVDLLLQRSARTFSTTPVSTFADQNQTAVVFKVKRYGWGYGLTSDTIWFSIIILLMHVVLVALYFGYSFVFWWSNAGWTSAAWGSIGELVALAILSPAADELRNSGAGIHRSKTWMTRLRIREGSLDPERLELVVGNRGGTVIPDEKMPRIDKEYA
ncbi:hypothetical protein HD806DRAFT_473467 [Xylariaceae sp. AK1471]|nr:hypothetical protein HD806DRAFT_473467 [Xylariaceae sp. AK1471]